MNFFTFGFRSTLPIISGIIPFAAVMGSSFSEAKLSFWQAMFMNTTVYAGAAQMASVELMRLNTAVVIVVITGLVINLRFLLYSAAMSPILKDSSGIIKFICAFTLTDQSYAVMTANENHFKNNKDAVTFYLGTAACMILTWDLSVIAGYIFGNFAPASINLDFAIPLSFIALLVPTLKTKGHYAIAALSAVVSLVFYQLPMRTGLLVTVFISMLVAWIMIKKTKHDS